MMMDHHILAVPPSANIIVDSMDSLADLTYRVPNKGTWSMWDICDSDEIQFQPSKVFVLCLKGVVAEILNAVDVPPTMSRIIKGRLHRFIADLDEMRIVASHYFTTIAIKVIEEFMLICLWNSIAAPIL
jgi:hypothetical protein